MGHIVLQIIPLYDNPTMRMSDVHFNCLISVERGSSRDASYYPDINCAVRMGHFKSLLEPEPGAIQCGTKATEQ